MNGMHPLGHRLRTLWGRRRELTHGRHRWLQIGGVWRLERRDPGEDWRDLGVVSRRIVTDAALAYLSYCLAAEPGYSASAFKYHGCGIGTRAEDPTETTLQTEVGSRATGSQTRTPTTYVSVAVFDFTGSYDITELAVFSAASSGTMLDRAKLPVTQSVVSGTSLRSNFTLTLQGI